MVTEKQLVSNRYKFKHIQVSIVEKDENDKVQVFSASIVTTKLPGRNLTDGLKEINQTLWNQDSNKRPPGYWLLGSPEASGVMTSYFVSEEWLDNTPKDVQKAKEKEWGI
jgi:hypothetical protein